MSNFHEELATYLAFRQGDLTPESFHVTKHILYDFDCFLEDKGHQTKTIQEEVVNEWIASVRLNHAQKTTSDWVSILRGYLRFLRYEGFEIYLPRCPKAPDKYIPYIFSDNELEKIFATADNLQTKQRHPQNPYILDTEIWMRQRNTSNSVVTFSRSTQTSLKVTLPAYLQRCHYEEKDA